MVVYPISHLASTSRFWEDFGSLHLRRWSEVKSGWEENMQYGSNMVLCLWWDLRRWWPILSKGFRVLSKTSPSWRVLLLLGRERRHILALRNLEEPHFRLPTGGRELLSTRAGNKSWGSCGDLGAVCTRWCWEVRLRGRHAQPRIWV